MCVCIVEVLFWLQRLHHGSNKLMFRTARHLQLHYFDEFGPHSPLVLQAHQEGCFAPFYNYFPHKIWVFSGLIFSYFVFSIL